MAVSFTGLGHPMSVESLVGTQQAPDRAIRWRDLVPRGPQAAELVMTPTGVERLRIDRDGDGSFEETVPPTDDVVGSDARDTTAPTVSLTTTTVDGRERYAVRAEDERDGSGVRASSTPWTARPSTTYDVPVAAPSTATVLGLRGGPRRQPLGHRRAGGGGRRSRPGDAADARPGADGGWSPGTTTATLVAEAGDGASIREIRYRTTGAQTTELTSVPASRATVAVAAPGRTTLSYQAVADDGTEEPWQQRVLRIDVAAPTARLRAPVAGSVVGSLSQVSGTAADAESGVRTVEVRSSAPPTAPSGTAPAGPVSPAGCGPPARPPGG